MECQCPNPGWCERYKREMVGRLYEICKGTSGLPKERRDAYMRTWEYRAGHITLEQVMPQRQAPTSPKKVKREYDLKPTCLFQGDECAMKICVSCNGNVRVKVFACSIHGECTLAKPLDVQCCATCPDHQPKEVSDAGV